MSDRHLLPTAGLIRAARPTDLHDLLRLERTVFAADALAIRSWRRFLVSRRAQALVLEQDDTLAGAILLLHRPGHRLARIYSLAVAPARRGRGFGRLLLTAAEAAAVENGALAVRLEVAVANQTAQALYRSAGYQPITAIDDYYADGGAAVRMHKALPVPPGAVLLPVPWWACRAGGSAGAVVGMAASYLTGDSASGTIHGPIDDRRHPTDLARVHGLITVPGPPVARHDRLALVRFRPWTETRRRRPRWVLVCGDDGQRWYVHDPHPPPGRSGAHCPVARGDGDLAGDQCLQIMPGPG